MGGSREGAWDERHYAGRSERGNVGRSFRVQRVSLARSTESAGLRSVLRAGLVFDKCLDVDLLKPSEGGCESGRRVA